MITDRWVAPLRGGAVLGSAALLTGAVLAELVWGLRPCPLCLWQRAGHLIALVGAVGVWRAHPVWTLTGATGSGLSALVGAAHFGLERGWWVVPTSCSGAIDLSGLTPEGAVAALLAAAPVRCDEVVWSLWGLSMAGWNAALSALLCLAWAASWRASRPKAPDPV